MQSLTFTIFTVSEKITFKSLARMDTKAGQPNADHYMPVKKAFKIIGHFTLGTVFLLNVSSDGVCVDVCRHMYVYVHVHVCACVCVWGEV